MVMQDEVGIMDLHGMGGVGKTTLFKSDNTSRKDPVMVESARKVVEECRGLPLALSVIGEAMASKTIYGTRMGACNRCFD